MSKTDYVQLAVVEEVLTKTISNPTTENKKLIKEILELLSQEVVDISTDTATPADGTAPDPADSGDNGADSSDVDDTPKKKQQFVILVSDPNKQIKSDLTGWVLQVPEDEDCRDVVKGIKSGAYNFNASKKGNRYPVSSIGQAIANLGSKWLKPYGVKVKTKEAVYVVVTDNVLPKG